MRHARWTPVILFLSIACLPAMALAQGVARNLDELRLLTRAGETVSITDAGGREASGRIMSLSPAAIVLQVNGQPREWKEGEIASVRQRKSDSLGNGALWGLGIGAGFATTALIATGVEDGDGGWAAVAVVVYAGIGAAIGVGVDALITREQVIYQKPATPIAARWHLGPILSRTAHGARLTVRF